MAVANELITATVTKPIPNYSSRTTSNLMYYVPIQKEEEEEEESSQEKRIGRIAIKTLTLRRIINRRPQVY